MVTQRIANPYDQRTSLSNIPIKEFIILKSSLQVLSQVTGGSPGNKIFFIYLASGFGVVG
jgi:hypothetical protein